ncbi:Homeobox domain containing protein [Spraguea lophii 42_110]|uniref:Homeobox domain containing protein n=1 Tax=Spraguea lophii (strain 42_110) TaxID=1358809 RepID=S7WCZ8_SPRLO|nr:Homeobox domain containing protein [Spraguea lophii 42_110]
MKIEGLNLLEVDAAVGLLKLDYIYRMKSIYGLKTKKTMLQQEVLKEVYKLTSFPSTETRIEMALLLGVTQRSIQVWFQNKRQMAKRKKRFKNEDQEKYVNEYNKFLEKNINCEEQDELYDIPTYTLYKIIVKCEKRLDKRELNK